MTGSFDTENFQSSRWDHAAITSALQALDPAEAERVAAVWRTLGERYESALSTFADAIDTAGASGWNGGAGDSVRSSVSRHVSESIDAGSGFGAMSTAVSDVAGSVESARAAVPNPKPVPDDWTSVLPWNWARADDAASAEQAARATMELLFGPAVADAAQTSTRFPVPASATALLPESGSLPVGLDVGPNGVHAIPSTSLPSTDSVAQGQAQSGEAPLPGRSADAQGSALATGALAGALGGGIAQYANRVVAAHHAEAAEAAEQEAAEALLFLESEEDSTVEEYESVLEEVDPGSPLVNDMPRVAPPVIGE